MGQCIVYAVSGHGPTLERILTSFYILNFYGLCKNSSLVVKATSLVLSNLFHAGNSRGLMSQT